jgi:hypothetical protein
MGATWYVVPPVSTMKKTELTQERLKELLSYDPETGVFTRRIDHGKLFKAGDIAGGMRGGKYGTIGIDYRRYQIHWVVWFYVYGDWPQEEIDHKNGNPFGNQLCNLREATRKQNGRNLKLPRHNTSGTKGVYWAKRAKKWVANIQTDGKCKYLGSFDAFESAKMAYETAAKKFFGDFRRTA